jgi:hypothetical protein
MLLTDYDRGHEIRAHEDEVCLGTNVAHANRPSLRSDYRADRAT